VPLLNVNGNVGDAIALVTTDSVPVLVQLVPDTPSGVDASAVTYTPADPTLWPIPAPSNVAAALDLLAGLRGLLITNAGRVPPAGEAQALAALSSSVTPQKSGVFLAWSVVEVQIPAAAAAAECTLDLQVDAVSQPAILGQAFTVGAAALTLSQLALVTTNRAVAHTWTVGVDTGNATSPGHIAVQSAKLLLLEL
jgi:hypothetical protein